jgi:predicted secreted protein
MTTGTILTTVAEGTEVQVTGPTVADDGGGTWYPVQISGTSGFMRAEYLSPASG